MIGNLKESIDEVTVRRPGSFRLHVRAIIRDGKRAFVGSQSLRKVELDKRREIGVLINNLRRHAATAAGLRVRLGAAGWMPAGKEQKQAKVAT